MLETQRQIIVIEGSLSGCISTALHLTQELQTLDLQDPKKAHQFLGQEYDAVIFNTHELFDPNAFGAITGTVRYGGYLLLLRPENWSQNSLFLTRFDTVLSKFKNTQLISSGISSAMSSDTSSDLTSLQVLPKLPARLTKSSEDQSNAISAIIKVVKGHRRRPLIITADRGRGKSAALGIAAAELYQLGYKNIIICAPSKKMASIAFKHAALEHVNLEHKKNISPFVFYSPDELQQQKPKADLVLIDEAAAIPIPLLTDFVEYYSRIVFSSTQHGYEGSGRGFTLSFKKILDQVAPEWKACHLSTPIRWHTNDQLEAFVFQSLLLKAEAVDSHLIVDATLSNSQFLKLKKQSLVNDNTLLQETFGLLVDAHYQTKPSDFLQMLDDENISIYALKHQSHVIAVSLIVKEGGLDKKLATEIFSGNRRLKGHLVAQSLAANVGLETAPCLSGQRIMRIAVHPELQQQGFGSLLLKSIIAEVDTDYFSSSFGATESLVKFWEKCHFTAVYLSMKRDASSGTHSLIMLNAQRATGKEMQEQAKQSFNESFPFLLSDPFKNLEYKIVLALIKPLKKLNINKSDLRIVDAFAHKKRGYENSFYPIWKLTLNEIANKYEYLTKDEQIITISKIFQKQNWKICSERTKNKIPNKNKCLSLMRASISKFY